MRDDYLSRENNLFKRMTFPMSFPAWKLLWKFPGKRSSRVYHMMTDDHMLVLQVNDLFFFYEFKVFRNYFILKSTTFLLAFSWNLMDIYLSCLLLSVLIIFQRNYFLSNLRILKGQALIRRGNQILIISIFLVIISNFQMKF